MGLKESIIKAIDIWFAKVVKAFLKHLPQSLISLALLPFFIWIMIGAVADFSIFASIGYLLYCLVNLGKILEDIRRSIIWGVAYVIGAVAFDIIITTVIPMMSKGDGASMFSGIVIAYVVIMLLIKKRELKKR